jgi:hypothetical protein
VRERAHPLPEGRILDPGHPVVVCSAQPAQPAAVVQSVAIRCCAWASDSDSTDPLVQHVLDLVLWVRRVPGLGPQVALVAEVDEGRVVPLTLPEGTGEADRTRTGPLAARESCSLCGIGQIETPDSPSPRSKLSRRLCRPSPATCSPSSTARRQPGLSCVAGSKMPREPCHNCCFIGDGANRNCPELLTETAHPERSPE